MFDKSKYLSVEVSNPYLILSIKVIGVRLQHVTQRPWRRRRRARHSLTSLLLKSASLSVMTPNGNVKIPTKVLLSTLMIISVTCLTFISSSIKKISYNAIILALTVLFWCAAVFIPCPIAIPFGLSLWSCRDAGTTQMTRRHRKTSMTH